MGTGEGFVSLGQEYLRQERELSGVREAVVGMSSRESSLSASLADLKVELRGYRGDEDRHCVSEDGHFVLVLWKRGGMRVHALEGGK